MTAALVDPRSVPCSRCYAGIGEACVTPSGNEARRPHKDRGRAAERQAAAAAARAIAQVPESIEDETYQAVYLSCRLELEHRAAWSKLAAKQLETLVLNMIGAERARDACLRDPLVEGSQGQPRPNGLWQTVKLLDSQVLALSRALKLTPDTRGTSVLADGAEPTPAEASQAQPDPAEDHDELAGLDNVAQFRRRGA